MKSEKGLTFISTAILVVVIAAITFGVVYFVRLQLDKGKNEDIKTDMLLVEAKVQKLSGEYILEKEEDILIGTKLKDMEEETIIKEFLEKEILNKDEKEAKYYVLDQNNINEMELENVELEKDSYYIVDYNSSKVYYTKGYSDEEGEIPSFLSRFFQNKEIAIEDELLWQKEYANPLEMVDMMGALIENQEDYKINMWISLDQDLFINITKSSIDSVIRYLYERYPY